VKPTTGQWSINQSCNEVNVHPA